MVTKYVYCIKEKCKNLCGEELQICGRKCREEYNRRIKQLKQELTKK